MTDHNSTRRTALKLLGVSAVATAGSGIVAAGGHDDNADSKAGNDSRMSNGMKSDDVRNLYIARLTPQEDVETNANGLAAFQLRNGELTFALTVADLEDTIAAHIHEGEPLGPIAVWLHDFETREPELVEGTFTGLLDAGTITDDVVMAGHVEKADSHTVEQVVEKIEAGEAFVNVHTEHNPSGEISGRIERFDWDDLHW